MKLDTYETKVLESFEKGRLKSVTTKAELAKLKAAARTTTPKQAAKRRSTVHR